MPQVTRPQVSCVLRELLPQRIWTPQELLHWLADTQLRNERSKQSHARLRRDKLKELSL
jgi:hypothetical protein